MKKVWKWIGENKLILIFMIVYFLIRLPFLDQLNLLHDERDISLSGYSIAKTGKDLSGNFFPLSIGNIAPDNPVVSIYYSAIWWLFIPNKTVFNARLPYIFISSLLVLLIFKLAHIITKQKKLSYLISAVCCFSPWLFHITRLGMDVTLAFVTLLAAIYLQIRNKQKFSYLFYILTFYNYQGFRLLIPIIIVYVTLFITEKKRLTKQIFIHCILILLLFTSSLAIDKDITQKRFSQVVFLNLHYFDNTVIFNRNTTIALPFVKSVLENKITESANYVISSFVKGQDLTYLFKDGDYSALNGSISGGQFLFPLIFFYYLGFIAIGRKWDASSLFFLGLIPLGMTPSLLSLNGVSFGIRGIVSSIGYSYIIAQGIQFAYSGYLGIKNRVLRNGTVLIFLVSFVISITFFVYTFFFRRPILVGELFNENERTVAHYLVSKQNYSKQYIFTNGKDNLNRSYMFFNNSKAEFIPQFFDCKDLKKTKIGQRIMIISSDCMSEKEYASKKDSEPKKIFFSDISNKIAYFIFE